MALPPGLTYVNGALKLSPSGPVVVSQGGLGFDATGALVISLNTPAFFPNGNPALATGELCYVDKGAAVAPYSYQSGLKFDANGRLVTVDFGSATTPLSSIGGVSLDASGALVTNGTPADEFFQRNSVLLHFNGTNGSTTFTDASFNALTLTAGGNAQISTAQSKFGGASGRFTGFPSYLQGPTASPLFNFGSLDFTIEVQLRPSAPTTIQMIITNRNPAGVDPGFQLNTGTGGELQFIAYNPAGTVVVNMLTAAGVLVADTWGYYAVRRSGSTWNIYKNGVSVATASYAGAIVDSPHPLYIGRDPSNTARDYNGYMDEMRVTQALARDVSVSPTGPYPDSGGAFNPLSLFTGGFKGGFYDFTNGAMLWQLTNRTVPSGIGDVVKSVTDQSGTALHLATNNTYVTRQNGYCDVAGGAGDRFFSGASGVALGSDKGHTTIAAFRPGSVTGTQRVFDADYSSNSADRLAQSIYLSTTAIGSLSFTGSAGTFITASTGTGEVALSTNYAVTMWRSPTEHVIRKNGVQVAITTVGAANPSPGTVLNRVAVACGYVGTTTANQGPFTGRLYAALIINRQLTPAELAATETWMQGKFLP